VQPFNDLIPDSFAKRPDRSLKACLLRDDIGCTACREFAYGNHCGLGGRDVAADDGLNSRYEKGASHDRVDTLIGAGTMGPLSPDAQGEPIR
jgi:hypothetical protein